MGVGTFQPAHRAMPRFGFPNHVIVDPEVAARLLVNWIIQQRNSAIAQAFMCTQSKFPPRAVVLK